MPREATKHGRPAPGPSRWAYEAPDGAKQIDNCASLPPRKHNGGREVSEVLVKDVIDLLGSQVRPRAVPLTCSALSVDARFSSSPACVPSVISNALIQARASASASESLRDLAKLSRTIAIAGAVSSVVTAFALTALVGISLLRNTKG